MPKSTSLADFFTKYSYGRNDSRLMRIYREMWENGYELGVYGRYLRKPSQFEENYLTFILRDIAFWKSPQWWLNQGFHRSWSYPKLKDAFSKLNEFEQSGTQSGEGLLAIIAVNQETKIAGFGKPTGSVVLAVMYPDSYGIMDYRTWRALNSQWATQYGVDIACRFRNECADCYEVKCRYAQGAVDFDLQECEEYFRGIREIGSLERMNPRQVDMALWEYDRQHESSKTSYLRCV